MEIEQSVRKILTPSALPIPLEDIKLDLRVDSDDEDSFIDRCAQGAAGFLEKRTGYSIIAGRYEALISGWFCDPLEIFKAPFRALESIEYLLPLDDVPSGEDGWTEVDLSNFRVVVLEKSFQIVAASAWTRPELREGPGVIRITFTAGFDVEDSNFGEGEFPIDPAIATLFRMMINHWYQNRELMAADKEAEIIERAGSLLGAYRTYY